MRAKKLNQTKLLFSEILFSFEMKKKVFLSAFAGFFHGKEMVENFLKA